jgi:hypothetical protein
MYEPIRREEILDNDRYDAVRDERRRAIIELKRPRRVAVGPDITFVFENRDTALFQIQEILRAERIFDEEEIRHEIEAYSILVPGPRELRATMFIEIPDREERQRRLPTLAGIESCVVLRVGVAQVPARFHRWSDTGERASAVNYATFVMGGLLDAFGRGSEPVQLCIEHPSYRAHTELSPATRRSLAEELLRDP